MLDDLRLTELHEEWAWWNSAHFRRYANEGKKNLAVRRGEGMATSIDAEIRRRVAAQEIGSPHLFRTAMGNRPAIFCEVITPLLCGVPDAEREYPRPQPRRRAAPLRSWVNHATHVIPVEGCHLCQDAR